MGAQAFSYTLRQAQEHREERRREQELEHREISEYYAQQKALEYAAGSKDRVQQRTQLREALLKEQEQELLERIEQAQRRQEAAKAAADEAVRLASIHEAEAKALDRATRERRLIVDQSPELRQLRQLLQAAKVRLERDNQLQEHALDRLRHKEEDLAFHQIHEAELDKAKKAAEEVDKLRRMKGHASSQGLDLQLKYKMLLRQQAQDELLDERAMVDVATQQEYEEDLRADEARQQVQQQNQAFIKAYLHERQAAQLNQALDAAAEEARIEEFQAQQRQREEEVEARLAAKKARVERRYESIKGKREEEMRAAEEEQRLVDLMRSEERELASRQEMERRRQASEDLRRQMAEANRLQLQLKEEAAREEIAKEERFRQELLARFAEEDRLEQMNMQRRRMKMEEHKREAERLIMEKRAADLAAIAREGAAHAAICAEEARRETLVQAEKERLLAEAGDLRHLLPAAVLRSEKKLPPLTPAFLD